MQQGARPLQVQVGRCGTLNLDVVRRRLDQLEFSTEELPIRFTPQTELRCRAEVVERVSLANEWCLG